MPKNEEGEFELVVGNKQLLTIVFILMVLFGVVFSMGYWVGRNSAPESAAANVASRQPAVESTSTARPEAAGTALPPAPSNPPAQGTSAESAPTPAGTTPVAAPPLEQTKPVALTEATPVPPAEAKPPVSKPAEETPAASKPVQETAASAGETPNSLEPAPGQTFLQVAAVRRPEAELIVDVLKKKGFPARLAPVPDRPEFRVLVGPLAPANLAKTKADLEVAGFRSLVRKY